MFVNRGQGKLISVWPGENTNTNRQMQESYYNTPMANWGTETHSKIM